ncbi:hypothetical protein SPBR_00965 [Sporothrix brasiliensis 5110]|uniref:Uncharacterized protein n=1 Tax=Sporothrix brasiliensis 5110 TaxID=1398154 RepID=A0A0C2ETW8_9PEZI|nr:uncharacterized protein SPBR_00965 [Sporothrix brasiliensis 5110]KIH89979.1 hypothetical protein SPBR_00965 [Sporothrix brasiliensis 5110]
MVCNTPDITGYSAFWSKKEHAIMALHAHRHGEDTSFYSHYDRLYQHAFWIYFPLLPGERLVDIYGRDNYSGAQSFRIDLNFRTNKSRYMVFGPVRPRVLPLNVSRERGNHLQYHNVASLPTDAPTRIHYNVWPRGIKRLVFENAYIGVLPPIGSTSPAQPARPRNEAYFSTTLPLEGVVSVTPSYCRRGDKDLRTLIGGLLFSVHDTQSGR